MEILFNLANLVCMSCRMADFLFSRIDVSELFHYVGHVFLICVLRCLVDIIMSLLKEHLIFCLLSQIVQLLISRVNNHSCIVILSQQTG